MTLQDVREFVALADGLAEDTPVFSLISMDSAFKFAETLGLEATTE
jgi:hypothetical protein